MANGKKLAPKKSETTLTKAEARILEDFRGHYKILNKPMGRRLKRIIEAADFVSKNNLGQFQWTANPALSKSFTFVPSISGAKMVAALKSKKVKIEEPAKSPKSKGKQTGLVIPSAVVPPTPVSAE